MSNFVQKSLELVPGFTLSPKETPPIDAVQPVQLLSGKSINIQSKQLPAASALTNYNTWRYNGSGQYTNVIVNGGQAQVKLDRGSGTGACNGIPYIRMHVKNSDMSTAAQYVPTPLMVQNIQLLTPDGTPIQNHDGSALWTNICQTYDDDSWRNIHKIVDSSVTYEQGVPLEPNSVTIFFIPLVGSILGAADFFLPAVDGDMIMNIYFWPATSTLISGPSCTLDFLSLDVPQEQLDPEELTRQRDMRLTRELCYFYPYERIQRIQQNWNAGGQYPIPLNSIKGDVTFLRFYLRNSPTGSVTKEDLYHYNPIKSFQIQDSAGNPISGAQFIDDRYNRHIQVPDWTLGSLTEDRSVYMFSWAAAKQGTMAFLLNGQKYGAYPFTTNETLILNMAEAGTNEHLFIVYETQAIVSGGTYVLAWSTPDQGTQYTEEIAYNASPATVKAALEALVNFQGTVTVTGSYTAGFDLEMTGTYGNTPLYDQGYQLAVISQTRTTVGGVTGWTTLGVPAAMHAGRTSSGAYGISNGASYTLDIHAYTLSYLKQKRDRSLEVFHSG